MQYERSEHFALQASELTALPFPNRGVVSLTDRKIFLPHRDQQSHFHIRPVRGPDLAAGFLANFTFIFLTYVACSGLHLWPRRESVSLNLQPMRENHRTSWDELVAIIIMFFFRYELGLLRMPPLIRRVWKIEIEIMIWMGHCKLIPAKCEGNLTSDKFISCLTLRRHVAGRS